MSGPRGGRASRKLGKPIQMHRRWFITWRGAEAARNAAHIQQQIAFLPTLEKLAPMCPGYRINAVPIATRAIENIYGASLGAQVFENISSLYMVDPDAENEMLMQGFPVKTLPLADDAKHIQSHMALLQGLPPGDPAAALVRDHIQHHQQAMQLKATMAMQQPGGQQGGGGRGPQPGAQPAGPRGAKGPPGMIHQDRLPAAGAVTMPRKT